MQRFGSTVAGSEWAACARNFYVLTGGNHLNILDQYGYHPSMCPSLPQETIPARITAVHRERYDIVCEYGEGSAQLKAGVYYVPFPEEAYPTVGDFVLIRYNPYGDHQVVKTLPRKTCFTRKDPDPNVGEQVVAANFDTVFMFTSLNKDFNTKRLERYLALTHQSGAEAIIILTKADLTTDPQELNRMITDVRAMAGDSVILTVSSKTGQGLEEARAYIQPQKTIVCLGSSGVGKSSLINALAGEEIMKVGEIREDDDKGRHTTTHRQLILMKNGALFIDTPGMRELGLWNAEAGLEEAFADIEALIQNCRFSDCHHGNEPGCAVQHAIYTGELERSRWERYRSLKNEVRYNEDKLAYLQAKKEWHKSINKANKQRQKLRR